MVLSVIVFLSLSVFIVVVVLFVRCVLSVLSVAWRVSLQCWIRKHWLWLVPSRGLHSHKLGWSGWGRDVGDWSEGSVRAQVAVSTFLEVPTLVAELPEGQVGGLGSLCLWGGCF